MFTADEIAAALIEQKIEVLGMIKDLPKERQAKLLKDLKAVDHSFRLHGLKLVVLPV